MNLQLIKIKRQNAFDYSLLSEFMKKKNGKLIFTAGFGNAGKIRDNTQNVRLNIMQKFERNFQIKSIIKSYNEAFHIHPKTPGTIWTPENILKMNNKGNLAKIKEKLKLNSTFNKFSKNKNLFKSASMFFKPNISTSGKNTSSFFNNYYDNKNFDDNSVDYNHYFYNTIDIFPQGNKSSLDKDVNNFNKAASTTNCFSNSKNRKLFRNISQDCIYLFGQNKIIYKNKNVRSRNNINALGQKSEIGKTPFIDYSNEFNPYKTKYKLKKNFEFYKDKTKPYENFSEIKQEYIFKIRKMFEKNKNVKYKYEYLPSHKSVKNIVRKNNKFEFVEQINLF